jgi:hypothetical protein
MAFREVLGVVPKLGVNLPTLLFLVWLAWYIVTSTYSYWRLRHIPGPRLASFTSLWWIWAAVGGKGHLTLADACNRYGTAQTTSVADKGVSDETPRVNRTYRSQHCCYKRCRPGAKNERIPWLDLHKRDVVQSVQIGCRTGKLTHRVG